MRNLLILLLAVSSIACAGTSNEITVSGYKITLNSFVDKYGDVNYTATANGYICLNCLKFKNGVATNMPTHENPLTFALMDKDYPLVAWLVQTAKKGEYLPMPGSKRAKSSIGAFEIDCSTGKYRLSNVTYYSDYFASGESLASAQGRDAWEYPIPGTYLEILRILRCAK